LNCGERQFVIKLKPHSLYGEFQGGRVEPSSEVKDIDFVSAYPAEHLVCLKMVGGMPCVRRAKHPGDCDTGDVSELRGQLVETITKWGLTVSNNAKLAGEKVLAETELDRALRAESLLLADKNRMTEENAKMNKTLGAVRSDVGNLYMRLEKEKTAYYVAAAERDRALRSESLLLEDKRCMADENLKLKKTLVSVGNDIDNLKTRLEKEKAAYRAVDNLRVDAMEENKKLWKEVVEQQGVIRSKFVLLNDTKQDRRERHDLIVQQAEMLNRFETELTNLRERLKEASTCLAEHPAYPGAGCQFKRGHEYAKDGTAISHHRNGGITWPTSSDDVVKEKVELLRRLEYFHTFLNQTFHLPYLQSDEAVLTEVHKMVESYNAGMEELTKLKNGVQALIAKFTSKE